MHKLDTLTVVIYGRSNNTPGENETFYLSSRVAVMILVLVSHSILLWVFFLNHLIGHFFTHSLKYKVIRSRLIMFSLCLFLYMQANTVSHMKMTHLL